MATQALGESPDAVPPVPGDAATLFKSLIESSLHPLALYELDTMVICYANLGMVLLTGLPRESLPGRKMTDLFVRPSKPSGRPWEDCLLIGEFSLHRPNNEQRTILARTERVPLAGGRYGQFMAWDVTDEATRQREMAYRATHDTLTGLSNEAAVLGYLAQTLRHLSTDKTLSVAVIYLDLNGFKKINDTHGHQIGDTILALAAQRLDSVTRAGDMAARLHGDEFLLVCTVNNTIHAAHIVDRVRTALREPYEIDGLVVRAPASIGVAVAVEPGTQAEALIRCADQRMYMDKRLAKRRIA